MKYLSTFLIIIITLFFLVTLNGQSLEKESLDSLSRAIENANYANSKESNFITFILKEQKEHRAFLEGIISWIFKAIGIIGLFAVGVFTFYSIKTFKEIKTTVIKQSQSIIEGRLQFLVDGQIDPLKKEVQFLQKFQYSQISFVGNTVYKSELLSFVKPVLSNSNITKVFELENASSVDIQNSTVIVYLYQEGLDKPDIHLKHLLDKMKDTRLPLIIYTKGRQSFKKAEMQWLNTYKWYIMANMPLTLLNHIVNAAKVFFKSVEA